MKKRIISIVLLLAFMLPTAAYADSTGDGSLSSLINSYIQQKRINGSNISIAYYNTVSGEEYIWNGDEYFTPASTYKLPLNMYYYEQEAAGNISPSRKFAGYPLSTAHKLSLQYSDNATSQAMRSALGSIRQYKTLMVKYGGIPADSLPDTYYNTYKYNTRFMLNTLKYLYKNQGFFSEAIRYLKDAHPGQWFEQQIPDSECTIAQKYGWLVSDKAYSHTAGIIYADEPFLLVVYTQNIYNSVAVIGEIARLCYDYTRTHVDTWREKLLHFMDVYTTDWYADAVSYCTQNGIAAGTSDNTFSPKRSCTNAEIITLLWRAEGKPEAVDIAPITVEPYFRDAVNWAYSNGVINGAFQPGEACSRANAVTYMWRVADSPDVGTSTSFFDVPASFSQAVSWAVSKDITRGTGDGAFSPYNICSRAEIVCFIYNAYGK